MINVILKFTYRWGYALAFLFLSAFVVSAQAAEESLPSNPSIISVLISSRGENLSSRFGHVNLRISYGKTLDDVNDKVIGFGPQVEGVSSPLQYLRIGKKLKLIHWIQTMESTLHSNTKEKMINLTNLELRLSTDERNYIVDAFNKKAQEKSSTYHLLFENCSSIVARILHDYSALPRGALTFLPAQLGKKMTHYAVSRIIYPTGIELKKAVLKRYAKTLAKILPDVNERAVFEQQLNSRHTEFRILAYRRLSVNSIAGPLLKSLMLTESSSRQKFISNAITSRAVNSKSFTIPIGKFEKYTSIAVADDQVLMMLRLPSLADKEGRAQQASFRRPLWDVSALGLKPGVVYKSDGMSFKMGGQKHVTFWITPNLWQDPE